MQKNTWIASKIKRIMKDMEEKDKVWIAAVVDCEGTINIERHLAVYKSHKAFSYSGRVQVTNTCEELIDRLMELAGGKKHFYDRSGEGNRKNHWVWYLAARKAEVLLKEIKPYLIVKKEQAENFLALFENINRHNTHTVSNGDMEYREKLKLANHKLNQRGRYNYAEV